MSCVPPSMCSCCVCQGKHCLIWHPGHSCGKLTLQVPSGPDPDISAWHEKMRSDIAKATGIPAWLFGLK